MTAYLVVSGTINDAKKWATYRSAVMPLITKFGGRHLTGKVVEILESSEDSWTIAMFEFPTMQAIREFWTSPEYVPVKALRISAARLDVRALPGKD